MTDIAPKVQALFDTRYHSNTTCGGCGGVLEVERDAICLRCILELERDNMTASLEELGGEVEKLRAQVGESRENRRQLMLDLVRSDDDV